MSEDCQAKADFNDILTSLDTKYEVKSEECEAKTDFNNKMSEDCQSKADFSILTNIDGKYEIKSEEYQAKTDFSHILRNIGRKFDIIFCKWSNNKDFEIRVRTEIEHDNDDHNGLCDQWVDLFSNVTQTVWVKKISNTGPKIRFRKQYQCWTQGTGKIRKELLFDARRCRGVLDMKVLTDTPLTRRKNKHIRMGLNAVVKINFNHLHEVAFDQPFSFFVHNCPPQPEPVLSIPRSMQQNHQLNQQTHIETSQEHHNIITTLNNIVTTNTLDQTIAQHVSINPVTTIQGIDLSSESLLMCSQTLLFDPNQTIQVSAVQPQQIVTVTNAQHMEHIHETNNEVHGYNLN